MNQEVHEFAIAEVLPGKLNALVKNLTRQMGITDPNEAVRRVNAGEWTVVQAAVSPVLRVWKTIRVGTSVKSVAEFGCALERNDCRVSDWVLDMLSKKAFAVAAEEGDVNLALLSVSELGFRQGASYRDICARAIEIGLGLCPAEVGPQLRIQYTDQPRGEWVLIAMEHILEGIFYVGCDDRGRWLSSNYGLLNYHWAADERFVFRFPASALAVAGERTQPAVA